MRETQELHLLVGIGESYEPNEKTQKILEVYNDLKKTSTDFLNNTLGPMTAKLEKMIEEFNFEKNPELKELQEQKEKQEKANPLSRANVVNPLNQKTQ
jgi:hypothetical protein